MAMPTTESVKKQAEKDGIEFFFAQFVDMHAKPSAKLVPMSKVTAIEKRPSAVEFDDR